MGSHENFTLNNGLFLTCVILGAISWSAPDFQSIANGYANLSCRCSSNLVDFKGLPSLILRCFRTQFANTRCHSVGGVLVEVVVKIVEVSFSIKLSLDSLVLVLVSQWELNEKDEGWSLGLSEILNCAVHDLHKLLVYVQTKTFPWYTLTLVKHL